MENSIPQHLLLGPLMRCREIQGHTLAPITRLLSQHLPMAHIRYLNALSHLPLLCHIHLFHMHVGGIFKRLAKVAARDLNKPSSSRASCLSHTIITSIVVKLDYTMGECNVDTVAELVKAQVGFEVILLDCKLYPMTLHLASIFGSQHAR